MSMIQIQNLTFGYDGSAANVFENVSLRLDTDWKLGLTGRNGRGKTTFLKLLAGSYEYRGTISATVNFVYFPFPVREKDRLALEILQEICPAAQDWELIRELSYLNVGAEKLYMPFGLLSGGEQTKLLLAALFLTEKGFPLLDEPTNHLDAAARKTVSDYLNRKSGYIVVSHDRAFLDGCIDHVLSVNKADIEVQSGNFSAWLNNFERQQAFEVAQSERLKKDIRRLKETAKRTTEWSAKTEAEKHGKNSAGLKPDKGYIGHKAAKMMKRAKTAEARTQQAIEQKSALLKNAETSEALKIFPLQYHSERLLLSGGVAVEYDEKRVCEPVRFELLRNERVALEGANGCGKSSLLKLITGEIKDRSGKLQISSGLKISYVPQTAEALRGTLSDYAAQYGVDETLLRAILNKMDFTKKDLGGVLSACSEGQKRKVMLARSLCERAHLYVWDEPLNYIDVYSRMQIETLIKAFCPTMLFVEHDLSFRKTVATKTVTVTKTQ